jgi:hypothetical protein
LTRHTSNQIEGATNEEDTANPCRGWLYSFTCGRSSLKQSVVGFYCLTSWCLVLAYDPSVLIIASLSCQRARIFHAASQIAQTNGMLDTINYVLIVSGNLGALKRIGAI